MIDTTFLPNNPKMPSQDRKKWLHVGRLDPSKRIEEIIHSMEYCRGKGFELYLDIFGAPSSSKYHEYAIGLRSRFSSSLYSDWVKFKGPLARSEYKTLISEYDGFIHAFQGSLDKTLVEATLSKRIVVSTNQEYLRSFALEACAASTKTSLAQMLLDVLETKYSKIETRINRNYLIAKNAHTFEVWIHKLNLILESK